MATSTFIDTRSAYGTRSSTCTARATGSQETRQVHYELFLSVQDLLRSDAGIMLELPIDDWGQKQTLAITLGSGGFSSVQRRVAKGRWGNRIVMAYKRFRPDFDQDGHLDDQGTLAQVVDELKLLATPGLRSHPNINQLKGVAFQTQEHRSDGYLFPALMFDATSIGTLLDFVRDLVRMVDGPYWEHCLDVAQGLQALHSYGFIHGDVKCENVLMFPSRRIPGRNFVAKLTDFGCSMAVGLVNPAHYTRLRGTTIPYDAPEANSELQICHLPFTDIYSFGLLVWRVIVDGADPFNTARYRAATTDDGRRYDLSAIREDKRNGNLLSLALSSVFHADRAISPGTAHAFGEILRIALREKATERDLRRIVQILISPQNFQKRTFGLSPPNAHLLREFTKFEAARYRGHAQASRGLAEWKSLPPQADKMYHEILKYGRLDQDFTGFNPSRLSPMSETLRDILVETENLYRKCGQRLPVHAPPSLVTMDNPLKYTRIVWASLVNTVFLISKDAGAMVARSVGFFRSFSVMKPFTQAVLRSRKVGASMNEMLDRAPVPRKESFGVLQGLLDFDGGLAAADVEAMLNEETMPKPKSYPFEPSRSVDFHLLTTCRLPFALQARLFADISSRAQYSAATPTRGAVLMELAICYSMGFGVEYDQARYLAILKECCEIGYKPAQQSLFQVHAAVGLPLTEYIFPGPAVQDLYSPGDDQDVTNMTVAQINHPNSDGELPLIAACRAGNLDLACLLIGKGADCGLRNRLGETALHWIWRFDDVSLPSIVAQLIHSGADPSAVAKENLVYMDELQSPLVHGTALLRAVSQRNKQAVRELILNGASILDAFGPKVFHKQQHPSLDAVQLACTWHDAEMIEILLDASPFYPINAHTDTDSDTGLGLLYFVIQCQGTHHRMARYGRSYKAQLEKTIQSLLRRGATNAIDKDGMTVLHLAIRSDMAEILDYVMTVDVFMQNIAARTNGKTVFDLAIAVGRSSTLDAVVRASGKFDQESAAGPALDSCVKLAPGNDLFLKKTLEVGVKSISSNDKNEALARAFRGCQWEAAEILLQHGANVNGMLRDKVSLIENTVFGSVLHSASEGNLAARLDSILSLARKYNQQPEYIVAPGLSVSALHLAAGQASILDHDEEARIYSILLELFHEGHHLEARDTRGWTPLHMAISVHNVVAVRALLDAGADINSLALFEGYPVGQSPKDMLFGQFFLRVPLSDFSPETRNRGDRALEQLFHLFSQGHLSKTAKRSVTLRFEQRWIVPSEHRDVMDYVETHSLQPRRAPLPVRTSHTEQLTRAITSGNEDGFIKGFDASSVDRIQRSIQWNGIETIRFLRNQGVPLLRDMGLLDAYLCDEPRRTE